ncbi:MAG: molybdenum cofactor cytidylyltransferase [Clostridia bacterium]|nr:molybdenum cofactor cytidylyltransferase [Clostridia bacterium]
MIATVILAAGQASRMGSLKQLMPWGNKTILGRTVEIFQQAGAEPIFVIVGNQASEIKKKLGDLDVIWVHNPDFEQGMSSSIHAGIRALSQETEAVLLALGDLPLLSADTVNKMVNTFRQGRHRILVPCYQGKTGHPVIFAKELFPKLLELRGDQGARRLIRENEEQVCYLEVDDPGICLDIDDPQTYAKLLPLKEECSNAGLD